MKTNLTYDKAFRELEKIVLEIENEEIPVDSLAEKTRQAKKLVEFCESALRKAEDEIKEETDSFQNE